MLTNEWRDEAYERFPELSEVIGYTDTPYLLWMELNNAFAKAYKAPVDESLIERIYDYFSWCCEQPEQENAEEDLCTCAMVCFLEHIPEVPEAVEDMPWWFSREDVIDFKDIFTHKVGQKGFKQMMASFDKFEREHPNEV